MNFIVYNQQGEILRVGSCPDGEEASQAHDGELVLVGSADVEQDVVDPQTQAVVPGGRVIPPAPPLTYSQARRLAYPRVEEQLDMLWHAMDDAPALRIEPFYSVIKMVKDAHPKDGGTVFDVGGL
jgi:hypothetical protein